MDALPMQTDTENFAILDTSIPSQDDHDLALRFAPRIRFDTREPFYPTVIGYTVFRQDGPSPSFPRDIRLSQNIACAIEYAVWWDWDIGHLYELEHIWVYVDQDGNVVDAEASWHGKYNRMVTDDDQLPIEDQRLIVYSEPGKHAFAPAPNWFLSRNADNVRSCGINAGKSGVHVTPLFEEIIHDRTPLNNRLVHTFLAQRQFEPTYDFVRIFDLEQIVFVVWDSLFTWIPKRIHWWTEELRRIIPPHEQRVLRIAHRGASAYAQENSEASIRKAAELGADMVEIDIRTTADNVPVIMHDSSLKRVYGISGAIADFTWDELRSLSVDHAPIMPFAEIVALCRSLRLGLYLDIKDLSREAAESMLRTIDEHHFIKDTFFGSFRPDYLAEIKAYRPDATTSILFNSVNVDPVALARSVKAEYVHPCWENRAAEPHKLLTPEWIEKVRLAKLGIVCWHEERPSEIEALCSLGVDAICSDRPELLVRPGKYRAIE